MSHRWKSFRRTGNADQSIAPAILCRIPIFEVQDKIIFVRSDQTPVELFPRFFAEINNLGLWLLRSGLDFCNG
jgi:hypothetical protein